MINKFLILFFTIFSNVFPGVITDQNSNNTFNIRDVNIIGKIQVDDSFVDYVFDTSSSSCFCRRHLFVGTYLQNRLVYYMLKRLNLMNPEEEGIYIEYIRSFIHIQEINSPEEIMTVEKFLGDIDLRPPTLVPGECLSEL